VGDDTLDGGAGKDTLIGGTGNDTYIVDSTDIITESTGGGIDTIQSSVTYTIATLTNVENLTLTGTAAVNGTGNAGNNVITGNAGNNTLTGGVGKDTLIGGLGVDRFDYRTLADSVFSNFDVITGFNATTGNDLFLVSTARSGFSNAGSVATLDTAGIAARLTNSVFTANSAAQFTFGTRSFVAINDGTAGFSATTDAIIEVTGLTGTLGLNNFTIV
ncbi:MAG: bluetail domain-containing putative surface protein, partial [Dolichospermum sp.]